MKSSTTTGQVRKTSDKQYQGFVKILHATGFKMFDRSPAIFWPLKNKKTEDINSKSICKDRLISMCNNGNREVQIWEL